MRSIHFALLFLGLLLFNVADAQNITPSELYERGEYQHHGGFHPRSMASLVGVSSIIVKGHFGRFIKSEIFYGHGNTRESLRAQYNASEEILDRLGIEMSTYEIEVDEVMLGDSSMAGKTIQFKINELIPGENPYITSDDARLFFLIEDLDGTYAALSGVNIQILRDGHYSFDSLAPTADEYRGRVLDIVPSTEAEQFEAFVKEEIGRL